jgi:hypothetical protein
LRDGIVSREADEWRAYVNSSNVISSIFSVMYALGLDGVDILQSDYMRSLSRDLLLVEICIRMRT